MLGLRLIDMPYHWGFLDNNLDFFHPQTYVLNKQFPGNFLECSDNGITAAEFPINEFIVALIMKLTGNSSPFIFRLYLLLYSIIGLFFLFKLSFFYLREKILAVFVVVFAATSPLFLYYQGNFLPTIPAISNTIIALYFLIQYLNKKRPIYFINAMVFFTLAALSRTPFTIFIISLLLIDLLCSIKNHNFKWFRISSYLMSLSSVVAYFIYNQYLTQRYGSMFLSHIMPPENIKSFREVITIIWNNWKTQYFTGYHYLLLALAVAAFIIKIKTLDFNDSKKITFLFLLTLFMGEILYSFLMLNQFKVHDYYFLDTFYLPIILLLLIIMGAFQSSLLTKRKKQIIYGVLLLFCGFFIVKSYQTFKSRFEINEWDTTNKAILAYETLDQLLNENKIPKNSKLLVINSKAPNLPFVYAHRKGYSLLSTSKEDISKVFSWNFDYIVITNEFLVSDIINNFPEIINWLKKVADNGKISIFTKYKSQQKYTLYQFLNLDQLNPIFKDSISFEDSIIPKWQNVSINECLAVSGTKSGFMNDKTEFGLTLKLNQFNFNVNSKRLLYVKGNFLAPEKPQKTVLVATVTHDNTSIYYNPKPLSDFMNSKDKWFEGTFLFQLPNNIPDNSEIAIYLWNTDKRILFYDDFNVAIY